MNNDTTSPSPIPFKFRIARMGCVALVGAVISVVACSGSPTAPVFAPGSGDLRIIEVLVNPRGQDAGREWFELRNVSARRLALQELMVADPAR